MRIHYILQFQYGDFSSVGCIKLGMHNTFIQCMYVILY